MRWNSFLAGWPAICSSQNVSTEIVLACGRCSIAAFTKQLPTPKPRQFDQTASHLIQPCGRVPPNSTPPSTVQSPLLLSDRTHSAARYSILRRSKASKSGIGPNSGTTSLTISSHVAMSPGVAKSACNVTLRHPSHCFLGGAPALHRCVRPNSGRGGGCWPVI